MKLTRTTLMMTALLTWTNAHAATFTVTNTDAAGPGSLQQAIIDANANAGLDTIAFGIVPDDGMVKTIFVTNNITSITEATIIDGYTQPGSSSNTLVTGNNAVLLIEVTSTNNSKGINIAAPGCTVRGLVLNGLYDVNFQVGDAILIQAAATNTVVEGNFIGTDATGTNDSPRTTFIGVTVNSPGNHIGGPLPGARNVIGGCIGQAILLTGSAGTNNMVQGNYIGADKTGTKAIANGRGIFIESPLNQIGGTVSGAGNLISGNTGEGLYIIASTNVIEGNLIGLAVTGLSALPNGSHAVFFAGNGTVNGNRIGGTSTAARNVISGNALAGIVMSGVLSNAVLGNFIGTDVTGSNAVPNGGSGIHMDLCTGPVIGGAAPGAGNVVAGNGGTGISFTRGSNLQVDGNFIGTDLTGTLDLGNGTHGIDANSNVSKIDVGVGAPNTIAFNGSGLFNAGVALSSGAISNNVTGNLIYSNTGPGVFLFQGATQTRISDNSIFDNGQLGILLGFAGTVNDPCDTDAGDNSLQNFPVITAATSTVNSVTIAGFLDSASSTAFDLEFFANTVCDPSGFGEGEFFIGSTNVTTGANCTNNFVVTFPIPVAGGLIITATATDPFDNTSEFSKCFTNVSTVVTAECSLEPQLSTNMVDTIHTVTATVTTNGVPVGGLSVTFNITGANGPLQTNVTTAGNGQATFSYLGVNTGTDDILVAGGIDLQEFACATTVVWIDNNVPPQISCPANISTNTAAGTCARSVAFMATATGIPTPTVTYWTNGLAVTSPAGFPKGITTVTATASNIVGTAQCVFTVTVNDDIAPMVSCSSEIVTNLAEGETSAVVNFPAPTAGDNCPGLSVNCLPPSASSFPAGTNTVTCTAIDAAGHTNQCGFSIIVVAFGVNTPPLAFCADVTVNVESNCMAEVAPEDVDDGSFDLEGFIANYTLDPPGPYPAGVTAVTLTVTDDQGASASCQANILVQDILPPSIQCPVMVVAATPPGGSNAVVNFDVTFSDDCSLVVSNVMPPSGSTFDLGTTTVTATVMDIGGNTNGCTFKVIVNATPPEAHDLALVKIKAPKNINLKGAAPSLTKRVKVQIQNRSPHDEVITNFTGLVTVQLHSLTNSCVGMEPTADLIVGPPNNPKTLKPKQKLNVFFEVMFTTNCVPDSMKGAGHEDYRYTATVHHEAIDGNADTHPEDDGCPRAALPGGVDPNPDGKVKDTGCAEVKTDVFVKS